MFGDFSNGTDLMTVQNKIAAANNDFSHLPADVRAKFQNSVAVMLDWMAKPENKDEAIKLGLMAKPAIAEPKPVISPDGKTVEPAEKPAEPVPTPAA